MNFKPLMIVFSLFIVTSCILKNTSKNKTTIKTTNTISSSLSTDTRPPARSMHEKYQYGKTQPIADNNHPNLYFNLQEIKNLRDLILNNKDSYLVKVYNAEYKGVMARNLPSTWPTSYTGGSSPNGKELESWAGDYERAAVSLMIEPTNSKADKIISIVREIMSDKPNGIRNGKGSGGKLGHSIAFMVDIVWGLYPNKWSSTEKSKLKSWFKKCADLSRNHTTKRDSTSTLKEKIYNWPYEKVKQVIIPNWWTYVLHDAAAVALMSGDQASVDFWFDSGWPRYPQETSWVSSTYPPQSANAFDLISTIFKILPSGTNSDFYLRAGWKPEKDSMSGNYPYGIRTVPLNIASTAEAAFRNGMTRVYQINNTNDYPTPDKTVFPNNTPYSGNPPKLYRQALFAANLGPVLDRALGKKIDVGLRHETIFSSMRRYPNNVNLKRLATRIRNSGSKYYNWESFWGYCGTPVSTAPAQAPAPEPFVGIYRRQLD